MAPAMSNFSHELEALKADKNLSSADLVNRTEVDPATFSRIKSGERNITFDHLRLVCKAFPDRAARLLRARLLDECDIPGGEHISVDIIGGALAEMGERSATPRYRVPLPPALQTAMDTIAESLGNDPKLRGMILWIARRVRLNCGQTETRLEQVSSAVAAAALNEALSGSGTKPAPGGGRIAQVHYGKAKRKRGK